MSCPSSSSSSSAFAASSAPPTFPLLRQTHFAATHPPFPTHTPNSGSTRTAKATSVASPTPAHSPSSPRARLAVLQSAATVSRSTKGPSAGTATRAPVPAPGPTLGPLAAKRSPSGLRPWPVTVMGVSGGSQSAVTTMRERVSVPGCDG